MMVYNTSLPFNTIRKVMMIGVAVTFFACYFFIPTFFTLTPLNASGFLILAVLGLLAWPVLKIFNTLNDKLKTSLDDLKYNRGRHMKKAD
jgi:hypothetical protein